MNKTVMIIVAIVVLLCMCCVVGGVGAYLIFPSMIGDQFSSITSALGTSGPEALSTVVPTVSSSGKVTFPSSSAASSAVSSGASSKASSGVSSAPGAGGIGGLFGSAATKAKTATKYRTQFTWLLGETTNGKYTETPFIDLSGEMDNGKSHFVSKGGMFAMFGGDANAQIEIISADGKTFMKGVKLFGDANTWYIMDNSTTSGFSDFGKPDDFADFTGGAKDADIKKVRTESLDGQNCDVYLYDMKSVQNAAIIGALGSAQGKNDFATVDKAETNVWLCADGYVHKYTVDYQGHDTQNPNEKGALKMNGHLWDFNNPTITVTAPTNAKTLPGAK